MDRCFYLCFNGAFVYYSHFFIPRSYLNRFFLVRSSRYSFHRIVYFAIRDPKPSYLRVFASLLTLPLSIIRRLRFFLQTFVSCRRTRRCHVEA